MEHQLRSHIGEDPGDLGRVADVSLVQDRAPGERLLEVLALARREVVDHRDAIAAGDQCVDEIRADEPGSACDETVQSTVSLPETSRARAALAQHGPDSKDDPGRAGGRPRPARKGAMLAGPLDFLIETKSIPLSG